ncbi:MAG: AAA family ATPase [Magnetococcus sp. DMHC-6]
MRFLRLDLTAYGAFTNRTLSFSGESGLVILFGRNEAGKSTALQGISDLLFGVRERTPYQFLHEGPALCLGAEIQNRQGERLAFQRRKGRVRTLRNAEGQPIADEALLPFLGGLDRERFERLLGLDPKRLREGGQAILQSDGDVGLSLFEAGAGVGVLKRQLNQLEEEAKEIFVPNGRKQMIVMAKHAYEEAKQKKRVATLPTRKWQELDRKRREWESMLAQETATLEENQRHLNQLNRIRRNLPTLARLAQVRDELSALAEIRDLQPDKGVEHKKIRQALAQAQEEEKRATEEMARLNQALAELIVPEGVLEREEEIERLSTERGMILKTWVDLPKREAELLVVQGGIRELLSQAQMDHLGEHPRLPEKRLVDRLRQLMETYDRLVTRLEESQEGLKQLEVAEQFLQQRLQELGEVPDLRGLRVALQEVHAQGALEKEVLHSREKAHRLQELWTRQLYALPDWPHTVEVLLAVVVPGERVVDRYEQRFVQLEQMQLALGRELEQVREEIGQGQLELAALQSRGEVPTEAKLQEVRGLRDRLWRLIRRGFLDGEEDVRAEAVALYPEHPLPEAFHLLLNRADGVADQRLSEADRVARFHALDLGVGKGQARLDSLERAWNGLLEQHATLQQEWRREWQAVGVAGSVESMRAWLRTRGEIVRLWQEWEEASKRLLEQEQRLAMLRNNLLGVVSVFDGRYGVDLAVWQAGGLVRLAGLAQGLLEELEERSTQSRLWRENHYQVREKRAMAQQRVEGLQGELTEWRQAWSVAMRALGQPEMLQPVEVKGLLELFVQLNGLLVKKEELLGRIQGMRRDLSTFDVWVAGLGELEDFAPEWRAEERVAWWRKRLQMAKMVQEKRLNLEKELLRRKKEQEKAQEAFRQAELGLQRLGVVYGCVEELQMVALEQKAERKRQCQGELLTLEKELLREGDGLTLNKLAEEAEGMDRDLLPARLERLQSQNQESTARCLSLTRQLGEVSRELVGLTETGGSAADAAQEMAENLVRMEEGARHYIRLRLAAGLIRAAVFRYQQRYQNPVLLRASGLFEALTCGAFVGLESELDEEGRPLLMAKRVGGGRITVSQMSDGTLDQLYLAFRLALVGIREQQQEPLPFILDDILIHFDDQRAAAALRVLAQVSRGTQVLFFTHHEHLLLLAQKVLPEGVVAYQRL